MRIPYALLLAHLRRNWLRSLLTVLSVFVAVLIFGFLRTMLHSMAETVAKTTDQRMVVMSSISLFQYLPHRMVDDLSRFPGVKAVDPWTWFGGVYIDDAPEHQWARFGVEPSRFREVSGQDISMSDEAWDKWISTPTGCIIGVDLQNAENIRLGGRVTLKGRSWPGDLELDVVGIYKPNDLSFDSKTLFLHWKYMNEKSKALAGRADQISTVTLDIAKGTRGPAVGSAIDAQFESSDTGTRTLTQKAFAAQFNAMFGNLPFFFRIIGSIVLLACFMVTVNTMALNARERVKEVGILKSLGFGPLRVSLMVLIEGVLLCLLGGALAMLIIQPLDGQYLMWVKAIVPPSTLLLCFLVSLGLGLVSGLIPAWIAGRMSIIEAIRRRA